MLGLAGASATALVAGVVAVVRWLARLDDRLDLIDRRADEANLRAATIEREMFTNGGDSLRDVVNKVSETQDRIAGAVSDLAASVDDVSAGAAERGRRIAALESKVEGLERRRRGTSDR